MTEAIEEVEIKVPGDMPVCELEVEDTENASLGYPEARSMDNSRPTRVLGRTIRGGRSNPYASGVRPSAPCRLFWSLS